MLIITDDNNQIVAVWSGSLNSLETIYPDNPEMLVLYKDYIVKSDDLRLISNPSEYRLILDNNGDYLEHTIKPFVKLTLDKTSIISDNVDETILTINIQDVRANEFFDTLDIFFNDTSYNVTLNNNSASIPISSPDKMTILISIKDKNFRSFPVQLEVI